jgi:hypothetical protein
LSVARVIAEIQPTNDDPKHIQKRDQDNHCAQPYGHYLLVPHSRQNENASKRDLIPEQPDTEPGRFGQRGAINWS